MSETAPDLNIADLATEADIRAAMADDRYWEAGNPDRESYVQQVSDAWQRLEESAHAEERQPGRAGAEPVSTPGPDMPLGSRPMVMFFGGAGDGTTRIVQNFYDRYAAETRESTDTRYFPHDAGGTALTEVRALPEGYPVILVGHSWGGNTAAELAAG